MTTSKQATSSRYTPEVRIMVCAYFMNLGETTRAIEIGKAICQESENNRSDLRVDLCFCSNRTASSSSSYEWLVREAGFEVQLCEPEMDDDMFQTFLETERDGGNKGFFPPPYQDRTALHIRGVMEVLERWNPTLVVHGLFPEVSVATKILKIPTVTFFPLPTARKWISMIKTLFSEEQPTEVTTEFATQKQEEQAGVAFDPVKSTLYRAATECGWLPESPKDASRLFSSADVTLVCDLESNYANQDKSMFDPQMYFVGPIFATIHHDKKSDPESLLMKKVEQLFSTTNEAHKVFLTMGSSGSKVYVREAIRALCLNPGEFRAVVAVPRNACSPEDMKQLAACRDGKAQDNDDSSTVLNSVLLTNEIVPFDKIVPLVDVVLMHGGQGRTVQSVISQGKPILGIGMQFEQRFHLDNVERRGAGIRLAQKDWKARKNIRKALLQVLQDPLYERSAREIQAEMTKVDGPTNAAVRVIDFSKQCAFRKSCQK